MECCVVSSGNAWSLCGSVYVQNVNNRKAVRLSVCTLFCFPLRSETGQVGGCRSMWSKERVTLGERESFSWTHFMDVLGSKYGNRGDQATHSFL